MMKKRQIVRAALRFLFAVSLSIAGTNAIARAQSPNDTKTQPTMAPGTLSQSQIDNIVRKFSAKETEFRRALNSYAFKRDALVQILGMGGQITGEYHRVSEF